MPINSNITDVIRKQRNAVSAMLNKLSKRIGVLQCERKKGTAAAGGYCSRGGQHLGADKTLLPALSELLQGKNVASFGDGTGEYKTKLLGLGQIKSYDSYDGGPFTEEESKGNVKYMDLTIPHFGLPVYDWVVSIEVAEHIPKEYEEIFLDNIFRHANEGIILSWAVPGQGGLNHVNNKPIEYVIEVMNKHGSSKGMEPDMALSMVTRMDNRGCTVGIIHADNDSTTTSRLKQKYKHLPKGEPLSNENLRKHLETVTENYKKRSSQLVDLGSTQSNENFNNIVASKAPKNRSYGGTSSLKARVSAAVLQKNEGYTWVNKVNKKALLSPGTISVRVGQRIDRKRLWQKKNSSSVLFKRDRFKRKHKKTFQQIKAAVLEGETYQPQIEENVSVRDIETIPTKYSLEGIDNYVVFDLETTGLSRTSDITQISAYDGTNMLNLYVSPRQSISSKASDVTGITFSFERNQMYCHGVPVESVCIRTALLQLIEMIQKKSRPVLVGHNIHSYDVPVLRNLLREFNLLSSFDNLIYGCIDTLKIAKREIPKADVQNYKQQTLVQKFLEIVYDAHNSEEDVRSQGRNYL
ncbi:unnamed protein product [Mytilus edulis]|uniref:Exonuclease domain-containing protein n=1 Tax=Mytilus edulis TaxID=6550 RepID=A0A8S3SWM0_MYTED|nr:unnamed protein product [Mytilus edulis]